MKYLLIVLIFCQTVNSYSQRKCGTPIYYQSIINYFPEIKPRFAYKNLINESAIKDDGKVIRIAVVVHVVFNNNQEKVSIEQIQSQIKVLNEDFAAKNIEYSHVPTRFINDTAGDCKIEFFLADTTWTKTNKEEFRIDLKAKITKDNDQIKFSEKGGKDGYPSDKYLNIWVGNIQGVGYPKDSLFGYTIPAGGLNDFDGVVINYHFFGTINSSSPYNLGRTVTHEVGHWLNLLHISGDGTPSACGNDFVDDTPTQGEQNYRCPEGVKKNCSSDSQGEMYMNYMDYVDDACMFMFSKKQKERMRNCFFNGGMRSSFAFNPEIDHNYHGLVGGWAFLNLPIIRDVKQQNGKVIIDWQESMSAKNYIVFLKKVKDVLWHTKESIHSNNAEITGVKSGELYEIMVKAQFSSGKVLESPRYLFIGDKNSNTFLKELKVVPIQ